MPNGNWEKLFVALGGLLLLSGCVSLQTDNQLTTADVAVQSDDVAPRAPYPSTYKPLPSEDVMIVNAIILDGRGQQFNNAELLVRDGKVSAIGTDLTIPEGVKIVDVEGKWVTPGIIDSHSHVGVWPSHGGLTKQDANETTNPNTAYVWVEHSVWPQDPGFTRALAAGVTVMQILPGSANLFGGRGVTVKNKPSRTVQEMKFPEAPYGFKMACGENPISVYATRGGPATRMGNMAGYRQAWMEAEAYKRSWEIFEKKRKADPDTEPPRKDLMLETLKGVLDGEILVHMHCYKADEMVQIIDLAKEFNYKVGTFHHAIEAYKIAELLAENDVGAAMWADWWGFKFEAYDGIRENISFVHNAGANAIVHSDDPNDMQRLNQEAAKALRAGRNAGLNITKAEAWRWLSYNPSKSLGIDQYTGSLEVGKNADFVIWSGDPFSVYAKAEKVYLDGALLWDLYDKALQPISDFEVGQVGEGDAK